MVKLSVNLDEIFNYLKPLKNVVVAFSGGVDSALLSELCVKALGFDNSLIVTADSPSLPRDELVQCGKLAASRGWQFRAVTTNEFENDKYLRNDENRCSYCKTSLMDALVPIALERGAIILLGIHAEDSFIDRPGQRTAQKLGAMFPFLDLGLTKLDIRKLAEEFDLDVHDKPSSACLSSRIPTGERVSIRKIRMVEEAEKFIKSFGISEVRVRIHNDIARIELRDTNLLIDELFRNSVVKYLKNIGFKYVTLDLCGFRDSLVSDVSSVVEMSEGKI